MDAIVLDEAEFLDAMKKLKIGVSEGVGAFKLYNTGDIASKESRIRVVPLKYTRPER